MKLLGIAKASKTYDNGFESHQAHHTKNNLKLVNTGELDSIAKVKNLPAVPNSYEQSYTRAIRMLELSIEDIIELDDTTFNQLVLDEWGWKSNFQLSGSLYKSLI